MRIRRTPNRLSIVLALLLGACGDDPSTPSTEQPVRDDVVPSGWSGSGLGYEAGTVRGLQRAGIAAGYLRSVRTSPEDAGVLLQVIRADDYRGKRIRWTGWVRRTDVGGDGFGLWMRVDGPGVILAFDNMSERSLLGTADWEQVSVVLDVPERSIGIALGALLVGPGDVILDDFTLEIVGPEVPTTDELDGPVETDVDSVLTVAHYASRASVAVNLDFEAVAGPADATVAYLRRTAVPFATVDPAASDTDLEPLRDMVGSARIVAMGEGTHGTREFFLLKHRVFQFLVRQMGFTHFAIEAAWAESNLLNDYVLTGEGDPAELLEDLYFWTWNTQEVLDLILWMREWNTTAPPDRQVRFLGFDMQFPGMAIDNVTAYVQQVDPASLDYAANRMACIVPFRNHGNTFAQPSSNYAQQSTAMKEACAASLQELYDYIDERRAQYEAASDGPAFARALRSARLIQQWEQTNAVSNGTESARFRDQFMAENTAWLLDQAEPGTRMMLWAHNGHVARRPRAMGDALDGMFGADYVNLGFIFGHGSFNAVGVTNGVFNQLLAWETDYVAPGSIEELFVEAGEPRLLLDNRVLVDGGSAAVPLRGPILVRSIGAAYDRSQPQAFFSVEVMPALYDLLMFVDETTASVLLPFD